MELGVWRLFLDHDCHFCRLRNVKKKLQSFQSSHESLSLPQHELPSAPKSTLYAAPTFTHSTSHQSLLSSNVVKQRQTKTLRALFTCLRIMSWRDLRLLFHNTMKIWREFSPPPLNKLPSVGICHFGNNVEAIFLIFLLEFQLQAVWRHKKLHWHRKYGNI